MEGDLKEQKIEFQKPQVIQKRGESRNSKRTKVTFPGDRKKKKKLNKVLAIVVIILIIAGISGLIYFKAGQNETEEAEEITPTSFQKRPTSTPVPTIAVSREEISIEVLNGTGISGEAAYLQGKLEDLSYENIDVGNADSKDYSDTQVTFSKDIPDQIRDEIVDELKNIYKDVDLDTSELGKYDIQIVVGLRKGQEFPTEAPSSTSTPVPTEAESTTPTPSPTPTPTNSPTPTPI